MKYTRLYTGQDGLSHFEEIDVAKQHTPLLANQEEKYALDAFSLGEPYQLLMGHAERQSFDWHNPPFPRILVIYLSGAIEMEVSSGDMRRFEGGSCCLIEDFTGQGHLTRVTESDGLDYLMVALK